MEQITIKFVDYLKYVQEEDLTVDGAMTDPKGDRSKAPSLRRTRSLSPCC